MKKKKFFASLLVVVLFFTMVVPTTALTVDGLPSPGDHMRDRGPGMYLVGSGFHGARIIVPDPQYSHEIDIFEIIVVGNSVEIHGETILLYATGERIYPIHEIFADGERLTFFTNKNLSGGFELYVQFREVAGGADSDMYTFINGQRGSRHGYDSSISNRSPYQLSRPIGVGSVQDVFDTSSRSTTPDLRVPRPAVLPTTPQAPIMGLAVNQPITPVEQPSSWAVEQVNLAIAAGLVPQNLQSRYTQATTRAEFTALAVALYEHMRGEITGRVAFVDTNDPNVEKMAYIGVVAGVGGNRFDPDANLTREQAAVMLARLAHALGHPLPAEAPAFSDIELISTWARDGVAQMRGAGIMGGVGNNRFDPQGPYTREQSIITIWRLYYFLR